MKNDPIEGALAKLDEIPLHTAEGRKQFVKALAAKSNLVVAKAARILGGAQWSELADELAAAFDRFIAKGPATDKACAATIAITRALVQLDYDSSDLFLRGMRHVQPEASWGPSVDTAVELRAVCAMGLVNTSYPHKLRELVTLMADSEWPARVGAIRAIAVVGNESASLLLRFKVLSGDREAEVMSECFLAVMAIEGAEGVILVTSFARSEKPDVREAAILALGASRRADAVDWLIGEFSITASVTFRKAILLSLSTSRTEAAVTFLLDLVRNASAATLELALDALSIHNRDARLREQIDEQLAAR